MESSKKTKIALVIGVFTIAIVASLMGLPFSESESPIQEMAQENIKKYEESEDMMLRLIEQEKTELAFKMGGKLP